MAWIMQSYHTENLMFAKKCPPLANANDKKEKIHEHFLLRVIPSIVKIFIFVYCYVNKK